MADSDEIPVSEAEQAFFDAMKAVQDVQDTQSAIDDPPAFTIETDDTTNTNGAHRRGSTDREGFQSREEGGIQNINQEEDAITSARNSVAPSVTPSIAPPGPQSDVSSATVSVSVPIPKDQPTDAANSAPTTPVNMQQQPSWGIPQPQGQNAPTQQKTQIGGKRKRLPQDTVGRLEDRIAEDPRGDIPAWLALIGEHKRKGKFDDARAVYERFFQVFPQAAEQWASYVRMELDNNEFHRVEQVFSRCLLTVPNVELWSLYLDYIRRRNNLTNDQQGKARTTISQAYDFVLNNIGCDKEAGRIWQDQIAFVKSAPGNVGGSGWMDQQKMDSLRKVYQKAVTQPVIGVEAIWREYDQFEHGLNKITAKRFLQERSPAFMTARGCLVELTNLTRGLRRDTLPRLPPAPGCEGEDDWNFQLALWKKWIKWEKEDPVVIAKEDPTAFNNRIIYVYKQALMALRFWPEMWWEAAEYCFENGMEAQGVEFLKQGLQANPESTLLTFRFAERLEATTPAEDGEAAAVRKGQIVRKPYDELLNSLYGLYAKMQAREKEEIEQIEEEIFDEASPNSQEDEDEDDEEQQRETPRQSSKEKKINEVKERSKVEMFKLSKVISAVWIDLMRAMRRIQGHGRVNEPLGGSRQIFADARKRGKITSDVYVASALIEYHCYRDPAALKIFERGMKLFPEDEDFALEYLKHLVNINDITNARAMFETFVSKVSAKKCRRVYKFFYEYEAHYGDLNQVYKLEKRMSELYPNDPKLQKFATRYAYHTVDPCTYLAIISPERQAMPKTSHTAAASSFPMALPPPPPEIAAAAAVGLPPPPIPFPPPPPPAPIPPATTKIGSPKRAAPVDDGEDFSSRARKLPRGDSPVSTLKGAAGRRLNQIKQQQAAAAAKRAELPPALWNLLTILPSADRYNAVRFKPEAMVQLIKGVNIPSSPAPGQGYY